MKHLILLFSLVMVMSAAQLNWAKSYADAQKQAKAENKKVMIVVVQTVCPWCDRMKKRTLTDDEVVKFAHENFVPVKLNKDTDDMPEELKARMVPTTFFQTAEGEDLWTSIGYKRPSKFMKDMKEALTP